MLKPITQSAELDGSDVTGYLSPGDGDCGHLGYDEVAFWTRPLTQEEIAILRLGPFGNDSDGGISTQGKGV